MTIMTILRVVDEDQKNIVKIHIIGERLGSLLKTIKLPWKEVTNQCLLCGYVPGENEEVEEEEWTVEHLTKEVGEGEQLCSGQT